MCAGVNPVVLTESDWNSLSQAGKDRVTKNNCKWAYYCSPDDYKEANCPE